MSGLRCQYLPKQTNFTSKSSYSLLLMLPVCLFDIWNLVGTQESSLMEWPPSCRARRIREPLALEASSHIWYRSLFNASLTKVCQMSAFWTLRGQEMTVLSHAWKENQKFLVNSTHGYYSVSVLKSWDLVLGVNKLLGGKRAIGDYLWQKLWVLDATIVFWSPCHNFLQHMCVRAHIHTHKHTHTHTHDSHSLL